MLRMTSSIRPRVFIRTPIAPASRHDRPVSARGQRRSRRTCRRRRRAMHQPGDSPTVSTPLSSPMLVRSPVKAKKSGSRNTTVKSSSFSRQRRGRTRARCGSIAPKRNAPNSAWMPSHSVSDGARRREQQTITTAMMSCEDRPRVAPRGDPAARGAAGRPKSMHAARRRRVPPIVTAQRQVASRRARTIATTNARMHHAVTSSTAAHASATAPTRVREQVPLGEDAREHRERGDAHRRAHEQREAGRSSRSARRERRVEREARARRRARTAATMLAWLVTSAAWPRPRSSAGSSSSPTRNMKSNSPIWLSAARSAEAVGRETASPTRAGAIQPKQRRAEQDARDHLADDLRLCTRRNSAPRVRDATTMTVI